ncbi:hypothetical protein [Methylocystis heyeri]|uniref:Roadblock/LC7 domain-containing protein n=1 Tax=Methylocystis heyeri TaxID=391905 RepID=A0A6B8KGZ8_9HYPH|nr:hypothetical protein [Methylocystis heyeri]QGM45753.1 hypothetical protein H2LOC_008580 [Methylocystis heyeri]
MAGSLDDAISKAITNIPECVAAGFVDIGSGLLLGVRTVDSHPAAVLDLVAAATADLFQGPNVTAIEALFKKARGVETSRHYFQEIIVNSDNLIHVFMRGRKYNDYVAVFICRNTVNFGLMVAKARLALPAIEEGM